MTDTPPSSVPYVPGRLGQDPVTNPTPPSPTPWTTDAIPTQPPTPQRPRKTGLLVAVLVAVALVAVSAGVGGFLLLRGPSTYRITGTATLARSYDGYSPCAGAGGYSDIRAGTQVAVTDAGGATVAVGSLDVGAVGDLGCTLPFTVPGVPVGKGFYGIEIAHRGILRYSEAEFSTRNLELSLGS